MYCYIEFKLRYLRNLKLFSIRVRGFFFFCFCFCFCFLFCFVLFFFFFDPIVLWQKRWWFFVILKAFSWDTDLWVTLGNFTVNMQNFEEESAFNGKSISRNEMWCGIDNHNKYYMCHQERCEYLFLVSHNVQKDLKRLLTKYQFFTKLPEFRKFTKSYYW